MAQLPNLIEKPLDTPNAARGGIVSYRPSPVGEAISGVGKVVGQIGDEWQEQQDKLDVSYATADYLQRKVKAEQEATKDDNYQTYGSRFQALMAKETPQSISMVRNPQKRAELEAGFAVDTARSLPGIYSQSEAKYKDITAANVFKQGDLLSEAYQAAKDPATRAEIKANYNNILDASKHVIGAANVEKLSTEWKQNNAAISWSARTDAEKLKIVKDAGAPLSVRNNNPGNIRAANGDFLKFTTPEEGSAAMRKDLEVKIGGKSAAMERNFGKGYTPTIQNLIATYAPATENDVDAYVKTVSTESGIAPDAPLTPADVDKIMPAMIKVEGGSKSANYFGKTGTEFDDLPLKEKVKSIAEATSNVKEQVFDIVNSPEIDAPNKKLQIDTLELQGVITTETAAQARRVLASQEEVNTITNTPVMADIITRIYDLNAIQETDNAGYLVGVQNIREEILARQAARELTASDALKLNNQLKTLTSAKMSDATQRVGMEFYEAQQKFEKLPPEYRGAATRELFYQTHKSIPLEKKDYNYIADTIVEQTNKDRRTKTIKRIETVAMPDTDFLKTNNITMEQVQQAARNKNLTEAQVIQYLRAKLVNK